MKGTWIAVSIVAMSACTGPEVATGLDPARPLASLTLEEAEAACRAQRDVSLQSGPARSACSFTALVSQDAPDRAACEAARDECLAMLPTDGEYCAATRQVPDCPMGITVADWERCTSFYIARYAELGDFCAYVDRRDELSMRLEELQEELTGECPILFDFRCAFTAPARD